MNEHAETDSMAPARGFVYGLALGVAFWLGVACTMIAFFIARALSPH